MKMTFSNHMTRAIQSYTSDNAHRPLIAAFLLCRHRNYLEMDKTLIYDNLLGTIMKLEWS
jgi:hypothetical protein